MFAKTKRPPFPFREFVGNDLKPLVAKTLPTWLWNKTHLQLTRCHNHKESYPLGSIWATSWPQSEKVNCEANIVSVFIMTFKIRLHLHLSNPIKLDELPIRSQARHMAACAVPKPQLCSARLSLDETSVCGEVEKATSASCCEESTDYIAHQPFTFDLNLLSQQWNTKIALE